MGSRTKQPLVEEQRTDVETMRVRHYDAAQRRRASVRVDRAIKTAQNERALFLAGLAERSGLPVEEVKEALRSGRTPADILALEDK